MPLTNYAMDSFVAPELSKLTQCNVIDMTDLNTQYQHWVLNFVLNSMLRTTVPHPHRAYFFMFLRRAEMAFYDYNSARLFLQHYVMQRDAIDLYLRSVYHFENFMSQAYQALEIIRKMTGNDFFQSGDGSEIERLNILYGRSKHTEKAINSGQLPTDATMPVWLTNSGISGDGVTLTYEELAEILKIISNYADKLSNLESSSS